jgi:long-chain fatty acid transport protein
MFLKNITLNKFSMKRVVFVLSLIALCYNARAEGYQVNAQSQKNVSMGHTGTALQLGSSSVHFNPGALGLMQKKYDFSMGSSLVFSKVEFSQESSLYQTETDSPTGTPFYFYGAKRLSDKFVLSFGINTPYGNKLSWDDDWEGRYLIQNISLAAIVAQPTLSYKINEKLGIGAGLMIAIGGVEINKALFANADGSESTLNLDGKASTSFGFNTGIYYQMNSSISLGINYRSKIQMKVEGGDATFDVPSYLSAYFPADNKFDAELPLPANLTLGVGIEVNDKLTLAADLQYVFWDAYDELVFDFETNTDYLSDSTNPRKYENTMIYRLGAEYIISNKIIVRGGAYYDETPISDDYLNPETPGMNKIGLSMGASVFINEKLSVDASFLYIKGMERDAGYSPEDFYGTYKSTAILPGIGLSYAF